MYYCSRRPSLSLSLSLAFTRCRIALASFPLSLSVVVYSSFQLLVRVLRVRVCHHRRCTVPLRLICSRTIVRLRLIHSSSHLPCVALLLSLCTNSSQVPPPHSTTRTTLLQQTIIAHITLALSRSATNRDILQSLASAHTTHSQVTRAEPSTVTVPSLPAGRTCGRSRWLDRHSSR